MVVVEEEEKAAKKHFHHKEEEGVGAEFVARVAVMVSCDVTSGEDAR